MSLFKIEKPNIQSNLLQDRFLVPPFSVLDTKMGYWRERVNFWKSLGIESEVGRGDNQENVNGNTRFGKCLPSGFDEKYGRKQAQATSIFDPCLCEIVYRWFSNKGDNVLDCFAGGSVRGIICGALGRNYFGVDLSEVQVEANRAQFNEISNKYNGVNKVNWYCGDSTNIKDIVPSQEYNLLFTCPPILI